MDDTPLDPELGRSLHLLRWLVTGLTAVMIVGLIVLIVLFVTRFPSAPPPMPDVLDLPDGTKATAFTRGSDWWAVVTSDDRILIYDVKTGALRQEITLN